MGAIELVEKSQLAERPAMKAGDTVRVHVKVREGDKERIQIFEGVVIGLHRGGPRASFTVRKVSFGQGVERIFPLHSQIIQKVEGGVTFHTARSTAFPQPVPGIAPAPGPMRVPDDKLRTVLGITSVAVKQGTQPLAITDSELVKA